MSRDAHDSGRDGHGVAVIRLPWDGATQDEAKGLRFGVGIVAVAMFVPAIAMVASGQAIPRPPIPVVLILVTLLVGVIALAVGMARRVRWSEIDFARGETRIAGQVSRALGDVVALAWIDTAGATQVGHIEAPLSHVSEKRVDLLFITRDARPEVQRALESAREQWKTTRSPKSLVLRSESLRESLAENQPGVVRVAGAIATPAAQGLRARLAQALPIPLFERDSSGRWTLLPE